MMDLSAQMAESSRGEEHFDDVEGMSQVEIKDPETRSERVDSGLILEV
jgi:hypothetical protein